MIVPPGVAGVAYSQAAEGDMRSDHAARDRFSSAVGLPAEWAMVRQVHGANVVRADGPGDLGDADALWTTAGWLPLAVFTADCFAVVLRAPGAVGVAHAGWRGVREGVVTSLRDEMAAAGHLPDLAVLGPGIGPCCFEVGPEVARLFPDHVVATTEGSTSVDLARVIVDQLTGTRTMAVGDCTRHDDRYFSHRRERTGFRMAGLGWIP